MKKIIFGFWAFVCVAAFGEITVIDGVKYECVDGMCMIVDDDMPEVDSATDKTDLALGELKVARIGQGYMNEERFLAFLHGEEGQIGLLDANSSSDFSVVDIILCLIIILAGGLAMNLTPCVLPMIPINLMIIGKSAMRGAWYGLGIALAYGVLGVLSAVCGMAFGTIQGNPWFNLGIAILFVVLALALSGVFFIDFSKKRGGLAQKKTSMMPWLFAFFMGIVSAVLAGACVAPILISVLLLTAKLYAEGQFFALALPFVLGLGMALPWPFLGAGLKVLPKPGAWMKWVNRAFALLVLGFAMWYGYLAYTGVFPSTETTTHEGTIAATPATLPEKIAALDRTEKKPILVDCWASWCKNCAAMDGVLASESVKKELEGYTVIRLQAEDMRELNKIVGFEQIKGLPAFVIFD